MTTPRIYFPRQFEPGEELELDEHNTHYLRNVLRLKSGEKVRLFGKADGEYEAVVTDTASKQLKLTVVNKLPGAAGGAVRITLAQSLPKTDKMDLIVQKATELGASRVVPFVSSRSIPVLTPEKARQRRERWQKIALEASRQCRRPDIPEVAEVIPFDRMLESAAEPDLKLILWEEESGTKIKSALKASRADAITVTIGPEGGFSPEEVEAARARGFIPVSLGPQVLKTETAALAALAIIQYEKGIFGAE